MYIREDFWYLNESDNSIFESLGLRKKNLMAALDGIHQTLEWVQESIFANILKNLHVELTDIPLMDTMALVGIDDGDKDILLYINLTQLVHTYEKEDYKRTFLINEMSCYEFAIFICLHEIGHIVHAGLMNPGKTDITTKVRDYFNKSELETLRYKNKVKNKTLKKQLEYHHEHPMIHKLYRRKPDEKEADNFAKHYFESVIDSGNGK